MISGERPDTVRLHEVHDSAEPFAAHLETPHDERFERDSQALVAGPNDRRLEQIGHARH